MKRHIPLFEDFDNVLQNAGVTPKSGQPAEKPDTTDPDVETLPGEKEAPAKPERRNPNRRRPGYVPKDNPAKALLKIVNEAVHYADDRAKMETGIEDKLKTGDHPYKEHPSIPQGTEERSGVQDIASEQFNAVVEKLKFYLGDKVDVETFDQITVYQILMGALQETIRLESENRGELQDLAVQVVMDYFNIKDDNFQFKATIVDVGEVNISQIKHQEEALEDAAQKEMEEDNTEEVLTLPDNPDEIEAMLQQFATQAETQAQVEGVDKDAQVSKRRMLNALIQGAANNSQYLFNFVNDQLRDIDPDLPELYGMMISANDLNYWLWSDEQMKAAQQQARGGQEGGQESGASAAGMEEVDAKTDPPTITAVGINFPVLIHELVKGVMEYYAMFGLPENANVAEDVLSKTEFLNIEKWDLRFGPTIWRRFVQAVGTDDWDDIKQYLIVEITEMPADQFNAFMKELISGSDEGKRKMAELAAKVREDITQDNYNDAMDEAETFNEQFIPDFKTYVTKK